MDPSEPAASPSVENVPSGNGNRAGLFVATETSTPEEILGALDLLDTKAVIVVVGSGEIPDEDLRDRLLHLFCRGIAKAAADAKALLIDGGTKAGVMEILGEAVVSRGQTTPLLGVVPAGQVTYPNAPAELTGGGRKLLDPNHSHVVLVPSADWGGETETMLRLAAARTPEVPVVMVLAGGGEIAGNETLGAVRHGWPIIVIEGSGKLADDIAAASRQPPKSRAPIDDRIAAEIVADGDIYLFPMQSPPEGFARLIYRQLLQRHMSLNLAWQRFALFDANATYQQKMAMWLQHRILWLGLIATALVVADVVARMPFGFTVWIWRPPLFDRDVTVFSVLWFLITLAPITVSTLVAAANRYKAGGKWIMLRGTAEAVKREIFRYRTRTGEYALAQTDETTRDSVLALRIETAGRRLMHTEVNESALRPHQKSGEAPVEPHTLGTASGDDGYSRLTPEKYIEVRLVDQLTYYRRKTNSLEREIQFWRWSIYIFGGVGTLLAAVGFQAVVALTAAIVTSVGAYLEFTQSEQTLTKYNQAETDLTNVQAWWQALAPDQQATQAKVDQFVDLTETILESELAGWVQQMRDTLAELHEKQAPEDEKSKNGAKNEDPKK